MAYDLVPKIRQSLPFWWNIVFYFKALFINRITAYCLSEYRRSMHAFWSARAPTRILSYPARSGLSIRFFLPSNRAPAERDSGVAPSKAPIFFLIHGGGWVMGDPEMDDEQAHLLSAKYGFCVMSLGYRLAPRHRFPAAIHDAAALIDSVLNDDGLIKEYNLDTRRVVLGGFSAGGVMTLALAQLPAIRDRIHALVTFYPLTDFTGEHRRSGGVTAWGKEDPLPKIQPLFDWAYVPAGQNMRDPLLSPLYATREQIPHPLFMITAEKDSLFREGWLLARRLAGREAGEEDEDMAEGWEGSGVRYECAKGMVHCFTHFWETIREAPEWEEKRRQANERIWDEVVDWANRVLRGT